MTEATQAERGAGRSPLTAGFWDAAAHKTLVRPVCAACGNNFFSPQIACPRCLSQDWAYEPSSGRGTIYSATVVHRAPYPGVTAPYRLAIVDLEEGWSMLATVAGDPLKPLPIGTPVRVGWRTDANGRVIPVFTAERPGSDRGDAT